MGSSVVVALVRSNSLCIGQVGDSRIYLIRKGTIEQLTEDHSLVMEQVRRGYLTVEQAQESDLQNIILRALGSEEEIKPDLEDLIALPGDVLLLTTDGLTRMVRDQELKAMIASSRSLEQACDALIQAAKDRRGGDKITRLLVGMLDPRW